MDPPLLSTTIALDQQQRGSDRERDTSRRGAGIKLGSNRNRGRRGSSADDYEHAASTEHPRQTGTKSTLPPKTHVEPPQPDPPCELSAAIALHEQQRSADRKRDSTAGGPGIQFGYSRGRR